MRIRLFLLACFFLLIVPFLRSQSKKPSAAPHVVDETFFKWKEFSFIQSYEDLNRVCDFEKATEYPHEYLNYYCGNIDDTTKSYFFNNQSYHEFNNINFDYVVLHIKGHSNGYYSKSSLFFIKYLNESKNAYNDYRSILNSFKIKYGNRSTEILKRYNENDLRNSNGSYAYLNDKEPFSEVEKTTWQRVDGNIYMILKYIKEENLVIISLDWWPPYSSKYQDNLYQQSEYSEKYKDAFKEFDYKNGFKGLKFGMQKEKVKTIVNIKGPDQYKLYDILNKLYHEWFYLNFEFCSIRFNKKNQLCYIQISNNEFSNENYEKFINDAYELFGHATVQKKKSDNISIEISTWEGNNIELSIVRFSDGSISVSFDSIQLDDLSSTDKLY